MYLHLGKDIAVSISDIIGIFDLDTTTYSKITRSFLTASEKAKEVINVSEDLPKSYVLCTKNGKKSIYITPISSQTLLKRAQTRPLPDHFFIK